MENSTLRRWLLIAVAAVLACACVWAEAHNKLHVAQGTYVGTLFVLAVAGVDWWREHPRQTDTFPPEQDRLYQALKYLLLAFGIGIVAVMIVAVGMDHWEQGIVAKSTGTGILFAGGTFAIGMLFGFLFGFPPADSSATHSAAQTSNSPSQGASKQRTSPFQHTNLHEISDWLTKVIVGAGLVDLTRLPPQVLKLAWFMAMHIDPRHPSPAVALAVLGYFSSCGVLFGFLWMQFEFYNPGLPDQDATRSTESIPSSSALALGTATSASQ